MNPKTLVAIVLAMLVTNETLTEDQAAELMKKGDRLSGYVIDDLSLEQLITVLNGGDIEPPTIIETPKPKFLT